MREHDFMTDAEREYWDEWRGAIVQFAKLNLEAMGVSPDGHDIGYLCDELFRNALEYEHEHASVTLLGSDGESRVYAAPAVEHVRRMIAFNMGAVAQVYGICPICSDGGRMEEADER